MLRPRRNLDRSKPYWLGKMKNCTKVNPFTQRYMTYEGFQFENIIGYVGDFVLVSNTDATEPDTLEGYDVARIEHLFETTRQGDKYRANVQWYSRPSQVPKNIDQELMDHRYEVFEDCRKFDSNVSVESIYKKCCVINAYEDEIPEEVCFKNRHIASKVFVCRYRLYQKSCKFYIEPVLKLDMMLNSEEGNSYSESNDQERKHLKYMPNSIFETPKDPSKNNNRSRRDLEKKQKHEPSTPKSRRSIFADEQQSTVEMRLRSALRKCSINSDSEGSKTSSSAKRAVIVSDDSDFENSTKCTPKKNPSRSRKKNRTPLKNSNFNTLRDVLDDSNVQKDQSQGVFKNIEVKIPNHTNEVIEDTPTKPNLDHSVRKRKASRSSSEESSESRSPSILPGNMCAEPPAVYKLYDRNGQTFVIKKPIDIDRKVSKKLNQSDIYNLLSSDESDGEAVLERFKKSGAKIVARLKPDNTGFELLTTPNKNIELLGSISKKNQLNTPKSVCRNLSKTLDIKDNFGSRKDLLLKKIADQREAASLRIKLRRSSELSNYKIDSDSDSNSTNRLRRRTMLGTPKSISKSNSKGSETPNVQFRIQDEIDVYSPSAELSKKLLRVEIKLKRIDTEEVGKFDRNKEPNPQHSDYYEGVNSSMTKNETPKKRFRKINKLDSDEESENPTLNEKTKRTLRSMNTDNISTPNRRRSAISYEVTEPVTPKRNVQTPKPQTLSRSVKAGLLTPSMLQRNVCTPKPSTALQKARARLHVSAVPKSLPCREVEFNNIYIFLEGKLMDCSGGCLYISGVPGTGKTATVNEVIRCLKKSVSKKKVNNFDFIEINAMKLTEPRQAYVEILKQLTGKKATWEQAYQLLDKRFTSAAPRRLMTLLLVDELDILCNKRQDVVYNLLDWPTKSSAQLVVITIANTMDLPERVLMGRVASRLGLTRLTFQPYTHKQLQEIVTARLNDSYAFKSEAVQLVARKVAAVSGDARRALDICRRATEVAETNNSEIVSMQHVDEALKEMITSVKVQAMKHCSEMERIFLQAVCAEVARTGVEEVIFKNIYTQLISLCSLEGIEEPSVTEAITICAKLGAYKLLICEHSRADIHQRVLLNVSSDDVHYAMQNIEV